jgi:cyclic pyranopterin phosphate synthase
MATEMRPKENSAKDLPLVTSNYCEISVADHCNLSCRGCNRLSPVLSKEFIDPDVLRDDLRILSKNYHADQIRLLGGEPLLHPKILDIIAIARESGIANQINICTNGLLLWKMPDEFWKALDRVDVSVYPDREMTPGQLRICHEKSQRWGTLLVSDIKNRFRESYSEVGTNDSGLIKRIYDTCLIVHHWHCHNIDRGYFYKCPQAIFLPKMLHDKFPSPNIDGLRIVDSPSFGADLRAYLDSPDPLASCKHCLGTVGKRFGHSQVKRSEWRQYQQTNLEEMVDMELLTARERELRGEMAATARENSVIKSIKQYFSFTRPSR